MPDIFADAVQNEVKLSQELIRVFKLPRRIWLQEEMEGFAAEMTEVLRTPTGEMWLRPLQAISLYEAGTGGGLFAPLRVGAGKTLISMLAPTVMFKDRPVLLVPAKLRDKTFRDFDQLQKHWKITNFLRVMTYEWLGRLQGSEALEEFQPDLVIADEVHKLRNPRAAVTRRVRRFFAAHPEVSFIGMSGTMTKRSLHDYWHLMRWAYTDQEKMPMPREYQDIELWADALDERKGQIRRADPGMLKLLCNEEEKQLWKQNERKAARIAFLRRVRETVGVVASEESPIDATLTINGIEPEVPAEVEQAFEGLRKWRTPDGMPLMDGLSVFRHAREIALGFCYTWVDAEKVLKCRSLLKNVFTLLSKSNVDEAKQLISKELELLVGHEDLKEFRRNKKITQPLIATRLALYEGCFSFPVTEQLQISGTAMDVWLELCAICREFCRPPKHWLEPRKAWSKFVRKVLKHSHQLDSELQVRRAHPDAPELLAWLAVKDDFKPQTKPVWLSTYALELAAEWAEREKGIIWCEHVFFAERLASEFGLSYYGEEGLDARGRYIEHHDPKQPLIASIQSSGEGRNLQMWSTNLVTSTPANGKQWEQLLGRTHRDFQKADEVSVDVLMICAEHVGAFWQSVRDSEYVDPIGASQKLLIAGKNVVSVGDTFFRSEKRWDKS